MKGGRWNAFLAEINACEKYKPTNIQRLVS